LEHPHPKVQERIGAYGVAVSMIEDADIRTAMTELFGKQALVVEPSSAITTAFVKGHMEQLEEPVCVILTGENIAREDFAKLIGCNFSMGWHSRDLT
jgi:threonine dehydratase